MIFMPCFIDFRVVGGYFFMCMVLLLSGCGGSAQWSGAKETPSSDGRLWFSATMTYEDRQMMRRYVVEGLYDGIIAVAKMQARIDCSHDKTFKSRTI